MRAGRVLVVLRGSVFLGDAMAHGMLPGVALAALLGANVLVGGFVAAVAMAVGVAAVARSSKLSSDTGIGLLLVGMLALGVVIVSRAQSFAVDLTAFLFGDVLAVRTADLVTLGAALVLTLTAVVVGHRAFVAVTFDPRKATTLGLRPGAAVPALTVLVAIAMVASFHVVGTLLVLALLIAPPATALLLVRSIPRVMALAAVIGSAAVYIGLLISWHADTAGGATIAGVAVLMFFAATAARRIVAFRKPVAAVAASVCLLAGCADGVSAPAEPQGDEVVVEGSRELDGPLTRLVLVDPLSGATAVYDAVDETETAVGRFGPVESIAGDGRFAYLRTGERTTIVDAGAWTFDHGDHYHYFATDPAVAATLDTSAAAVAANNTMVAIEAAGGGADALERDRLGEGLVEAAGVAIPGDVAAAVPLGGRIVTVDRSGRVRASGDRATEEIGAECPSVTWAMATRRAAVFGCSTGALRVTGSDGTPTATSVPYPPGVPPQRPATMSHRDRADVFAGIAAGHVWVLDSRQRSWVVIPAPGAVATNTSGDGTVLILHRDGTLAAVDVATRTETARIPLPESVTAHATPVIEIDSDRAYVNNAAAREVYEIDYADGLRIARTLRTEVTPGLMVEAGR
ncbi:zinc ABC transporter permease AztB [Mycolicibacterium litorale]|uniref:zinc ABC transporter permease AztB n=1 Tax=Mycolicibacterium litorale TaxID=758802 RepID=UPI003CFA0978